MFEVRLDLYLLILLALLYCILIFVFFKMGILTGGTKFKVNLLMLKKVNLLHVTASISLFFVFVIIRLLYFIPLNGDASLYFWQTIIAVFIGSVPIVWRNYVFSTIYFIGFIAGGSFNHVIWGENLFLIVLAVAIIIGFLAELVRKRILNGGTTFLLLTILVLLILWLPGVSFSLDRILVNDAKDTYLIHVEDLTSCDVVVYKVKFMGDELCYVVDRITRPIGILYRSEWFSGWLRRPPLMGFYDRIGQPLPFVCLIERVRDEYFFYIEPVDEHIEFIIIGNFDKKIYTLSEAKDAIDYYILIKPENQYIVIREKQEKWPGAVYPGVLAFTKQGELVGGSIHNISWYDNQ